jgi:hypothetical protein
MLAGKSGPRLTAGPARSYTARTMPLGAMTTTAMIKRTKCLEPSGGVPLRST